MRSLALAAVAALGCAIAPPTSAQTGSFIVAQHGTQVGTATVTFSSGAKGYNSTSIVRVAMKGLDYDLSKTEQLGPANQLVRVQLSATVNDSAVSVTATPDAAQILLNISANGRSSATRLAAHSGAVFLPDFDPGALDTLLALAVSRNNRDLWAILPKQSGGQQGSIVPVQLATYADEKGTLDGKPVTVHHMEATIAGAKSQLFSGPENQLLQAELPQQGFALVRKGFVLTPPSKAGAPPEEPQTPAPNAPAVNAPAPGQP
jgi:hypothetical protein